MLHHLAKFIDRVSGVALVVAAGCLVSMAALMLLEIGARFVFGLSLMVTWELSSYLMGATFLFGSAYTLRTGGHVRVSLLSERVSPRIAWLLDVFCTIVGVVVCTALTFALGDMAFAAYLFEERSFTPLRAPLAIPQSLVALGALALSLQMLLRLVLLVARRNPEKGITTYRISN